MGGINTGRFRRVPEIKVPELYSWVLNNYWTTNFRAYQEGELKWTYRLKNGLNPSGLSAARFGWGERVPFLTRLVPAGKLNNKEMFKSMIGPTLRNLLLVSASPCEDEHSVILQVREVDGSPAEIPLSGLRRITSTSGIYEVNVLGETVSQPTDIIHFKPFETKFIRLAFSPAEQVAP
jgi:hypothetical protein